MTALKGLEDSLLKMFKGAPALPKGGKDFIVQIAPWLALVGGVLMAWSAWALWNWAHAASSLVNYANTLSQIYGGEPVATNRMTAAIWLGVGVLAVQALIYLMAFPALKEKKKSGWDLLLLGSVVNIVYGVVVMFSDYTYGGGIVGTLIGTLIGWYFLFQIRDYYMSKKA